MLARKAPIKSVRKASALFVLSIFGIFILAFPSGAHAATLARPGNMLGIVGSWSFNIFHGTSVPDYSGRGNTGTLSGSYTSGAGMQGNAFGAGSAGTGRLTVHNSSTLNLNSVETISFWINSAQSATAYSSILQKSDFSTAGWVIQQQNATNGLYLRIDTSGGTNQTFPAITALDGAWHHIVFVLTNGSIAQYKDGTLANTGTYIPGTGFANPAQSILLNNSSAFPNMLIDDFRIYNRALSSAEVKGLYNANGANYGLVVQKESPRNGLLGEWLMNEGTSTTVHDSSGNGATMTLSGSPLPLWVPGKHGTALKFDGANNYLTTASTKMLPSGSAMTVSGWVKLTTNKNWNTVMAHAWIQRSGTWDLFTASGGNAIFGVYDTSQHNATISGLVPGVWYNIVGTYDGSNANVYVNGVAGTPASAPGITLDTTGGAGATVISQNPGTSAMNGIIDDVRIYNRALSTPEIQQLYAAHQTEINTSSAILQSGTSLANGLVGLWTFDGADIGTSILDRSGNGFNGYLTGTNNATSSRKVIGKMGQAFSFAGQNTGGIDLGNSTSLTPSRFTVAGWINITTSAYNYNYILSSDRDCCSVYNGIGLSVVNGLLSGNIWNGTQYNITSTGSVPVSKWTHVAFTYDGATKKLYINGALDKSSAQTVNPGTPASFDTYIGSMGQSAGAVYTLGGKLDDVRLYNRALSASEINQLYLMGK
jgi:hypothetical protein